MKAKSVIVLYLIIFHVASFAQDAADTKTGENRFQISVKIGSYYKGFWGNKYIAPTAIIPGEEDLAHQFDGFEKKSGYGFDAGTLLSYRIHKNLQVISGLLYCTRRNIYVSNPDTVYKYHTLVNIPIANITQYDYFSGNIELPIILSYAWRRFNFSAGVRIPLLSFRRTTYTYMVNSYPYYSAWGTSQKVFSSIETSSMIYPSFQFSYDFNLRRISLSPFLSFELGREKSFYLQGGVIIPLLKQNNK